MVLYNERNRSALTGLDSIMIVDWLDLLAHHVAHRIHHHFKPFQGLMLAVTARQHHGEYRALA